MDVKMEVYGIRKTLKHLMLGSLVFVVMSSFFSRTSNAIPPFARKYRTSCNTCHVAIPKLNAFGEAFRLNAYAIPKDDEVYVKEEVVELGSPAWKKVFPQGVYPGTIPVATPLGMCFVGRIESGPNTAQSSTSIDFPQMVVLFGGAQLSEDIGAFFEVPFMNNMAINNRAFIVFHDALQGMGIPEHALNLKFGKYDVNPIPQSRNQTSFLVNSYLFGYSLSDAGGTSTNSFSLNSTQPGLEGYGILSHRFQYKVGVVNGGSGSVSDDNSNKDLYYALTYKLGGLGYDGGTAGADISESLSGRANGVWDADSLELSTFGYFGKSLANGGDNTFRRFGGAVRGSRFNTELTIGYIFGHDDDPYGIDSTDSIDSQVWYVEADYPFYPWLIGVFRYELLGVERPNDFSVTDLDQGRFTPAVMFQIRPNIRFTVEAELYNKHDQSDQNGTSKPNRVLGQLRYYF